jgi:60 kDa SS-A/Ro ribonucleoprotein
VQEWIASRTPDALFRAAIGNAPSLADVVKMVHPKPSDPGRAALLGWLIGREVETSLLPDIVREYEAFKADPSRPTPDVPFQFLASVHLGPAAWKEIAARAPWQMTRMNLNTFLRHGVFDDPELAARIAARLSDADEVRRAKAMPYQLLAASLNADQKLPEAVRKALEAATETAVGNVPRIDGRVHVCLDVSGSMSAPVTGWRQGSSTRVRCVDVAALYAAAILRRNPEAAVLPFSDDVIPAPVSAKAPLAETARVLAGLGGGGTKCSAPLRLLNRCGAGGDVVIFVSDNESWIDARSGGRGTATMEEWLRFKKSSPQARLVCIDLTPNGTTQALDREDILNVGGFSDEVFGVVAGFACEGAPKEHWVDVIERVAL